MEVYTITMKKHFFGIVFGVALLVVLCSLALWISSKFLPFLSPLIIGILLGAALSPWYPHLCVRYELQTSINFSAKKLLRLGIILYGFYITFDEIYALGFLGVGVAVCVVVVIFSAALFIGKLLKLDSQIAMLVGIGSAVCGAAAILALESVLKSHPSKSSVALGFIVIFGLLGMIGLPLVYYSGILPFNDYQWGIFIGASLHEVANVVGAGAISPEIQKVAILVKMTRVVLLVPLLLFISYMIYKKRDLQNEVLKQGQTLSLTQEQSPKDSKKFAQNTLYIPYFALGFLAVIILHSMLDFPPVVVDSMQLLSRIFLTFAMVSLGLQIDWHKFVAFGAKTFMLALALFVLLLCGVYTLVYILF